MLRHSPRGSDAEALSQGCAPEPRAWAQARVRTEWAGEGDGRKGSRTIATARWGEARGGAARRLSVGASWLLPLGLGIVPVGQCAEGGRQGAEAAQR